MHESARLAGWPAGFWSRAVRILDTKVLVIDTQSDPQFRISLSQHGVQCMDLTLPTCSFWGENEARTSSHLLVAPLPSPVERICDSKDLGQGNKSHWTRISLKRSRIEREMMSRGKWSLKWRSGCCVSSRMCKCVVQIVKPFATAASIWRLASLPERASPNLGQAFGVNLIKTNRLTKCILSFNLFHSFPRHKFHISRLVALSKTRICCQNAISLNSFHSSPKNVVHSIRHPLSTFKSDLRNHLIGPDSNNLTVLAYQKKVDQSPKVLRPWICPMLVLFGMKIVSLKRVQRLDLECEFLSDWHLNWEASESGEISIFGRKYVLANLWWRGGCLNIRTKGENRILRPNTNINCI